MAAGERELGRGRFLRLLERSRWELVERPGIAAIVAVVAVTDAGELLLVEQYREPVRARVVELPTGLVGDGDAGDETIADAARRELEEETGHVAARFTTLAEGPPSAGLTSEVVTFLLAHEVERRGPGGGVDDEEIEVHAVPLTEVDAWLARRGEDGRLVDPKVWAGLYLLGRSAP